MSAYALVALATLLVGYGLTPVTILLARRLGAVATPRDRDVHAGPTPRLAGLAALGGIGAGALAATTLSKLDPATGSGLLKPTLLVLAGAALLGALDDVLELRARWKLLGQVLVGVLLGASGVGMAFLPLPGAGVLDLTPGTSLLVTTVLTVVTLNAVNLMDGLDGLVLSVVGVAGAALFAYSFQLLVIQGVGFASTPTLLCALLVGACLGTIPWNWSPARTFLGDTGTMLLGTLLVAILASLTQTVDTEQLSEPDLVPPLVLFALVLSVPFVDLVLAVHRRRRARRSIFAADREHVHHRLLDLGLSHAQATLVIAGWSALLGLATVGVSLLGEPLPAQGVVAALAGLALAALLAPVLGLGLYARSLTRERTARARRVRRTGRRVTAGGDAGATGHAPSLPDQRVQEPRR